MAGVVVNLDFDLLAESLERVLKLVYVVRGDALVLAAERPRIGALIFFNASASVARWP